MSSVRPAEYKYATKFTFKLNVKAILLIASKVKVTAIAG
jgi:hypothetical protein